MVRSLLYAVTPVTAAFGGAPALAQQTGPFYGPGMMWDGHWFGWVIGPLMMILILVAIVTAVVLLVRWRGGPGHATTAGPPAMTPLDILKDRFARGEIDKQEFEERRQVLEK